MNDDPPRFDPRAFLDLPIESHNSFIGTRYVAHGDDWVELAIDYDERLIGDPANGVLASGPIVTLMDMAASFAIWVKVGRLTSHATLDLRIDYLRPAVPGRAVHGRCQCYRTTRAIAFVRGTAHDGDPDDPIAHVAASFMRA